MVGSFAILDFGAPELIIIFAIVLLLFGGKKLPELSKSLGVSMKNLRDGFNDANGVKEDLKKQITVQPQAATAQPAPVVAETQDNAAQV